MSLPRKLRRSSRCGRATPNATRHSRFPSSLEGLSKGIQRTANNNAPSGTECLVTFGPRPRIEGNHRCHLLFIVSRHAALSRLAAQQATLKAPYKLKHATMYASSPRFHETCIRVSLSAFIHRSRATYVATCNVCGALYD